MSVYDRAKLVQVLVYHQRTNTSGCHCGWGVLGASYADHVADVYEQAVQFGDEDWDGAHHGGTIAEEANRSRAALTKAMDNLQRVRDEQSDGSEEGT